MLLKAHEKINEKDNARFRDPAGGHQDVPAGEGVPEVSGGV